MPWNISKINQLEVFWRCFKSL